MQLRRSWVLLSKASSTTTATRSSSSSSSSSRGRTVVRDPRNKAKNKVKVSAAARPSSVVVQNNQKHRQNQNVPVEINRQDHLQTTQQQQQQQLPPVLPFEPSTRNQQSVGSTLASYTLSGAGVAIGFTLVGALFGGF